MKHNIIDSLVPLAVEIDLLTEDPRNARAHSPRNLEEITKSLRVYGQRKPIVVRSDTRVVEAGNGMLAAARSLGWTHIAAVLVEDDATTATGYSIMDNRSSDLSEFSGPTLKDLLSELDCGDTDVTLTGFSMGEIERLVTQFHVPGAGDGKGFKCPQCGYEI